MRRALVLLGALAALSACADRPAYSRDVYKRLLTPQAEPSRVVAAELAFARAAQDKGQWTAFAEYSTPDAVMFVPEVVDAHQWLKGRANPPVAVRWQPHEVWSSCDGSLAATRGAWQRPDGSVGYFTTIWQRQPDGEFKWVVDQGDTLTTPLAAPEFVATRVARCAGEPDIAVTSFEKAQTSGRGVSRDGTLSYQWAVMPDKSRVLVVRIQGETALEEAFRSDVAAPAS